MSRHVSGTYPVPPGHCPAAYACAMATIDGSAATVLVVDDHPLVRHGLRVLLEVESWVGRILEAATAREAEQLAVAERPDVAVVDLSLPDQKGSPPEQNGLELVRRLRRTVPDCAVLVLTMTRSESTVRACLDAGACGYLLKDTAPRAVVSAIRAVLDGGLVLGPQVTTEPAGKPPTTRRLPAPLDRLAPYDIRLLTLVASGYRNGEIARTLGISEKTVRNRLSGILAQLGVADRVQAVLLAREGGLVPRKNGLESHE
jgi:two-component system, NarL family, nitrate/nitrite response regulator NarL